jgi:hypothetical protein
LRARYLRRRLRPSGVLKLSQPRRPARMPTEPHARPRRPSGSLSRSRNGPTRTESLILALFLNLTIERSSSGPHGEHPVRGAPLPGTCLPKTTRVMPWGRRYPVGMPMTREQFAAFVRAAGMGVVATAAADGSPEAALVSLAATDAGEVIFDCATTARKLANLAVNPRVALVVGWNEGVSLQVEGVADVLAGADRQRYGRLYAEQFPGSRALDEHFAVVLVTPRWLRYYDARPASFRVVEGTLGDGVVVESS